MPLMEEEPTPATRLKPLRGFQLLLSMILFHMGSYINSNPDVYMSLVLGDVLMITSGAYVMLLTVAIMTLRESDVITINLCFTFRLLAIPLYVTLPLICLTTPSTDTGSLFVKITLLFCFLLPGSFLIETLVVLREFRR